MENLVLELDKVIKNMTYSRILCTIIAIVISFVIYKILVLIFSKKEFKNKKSGDFKKKVTYYNLLKNICKYLLVIATVIVVLEINGINIPSLLAGIGIVSIVVGLAIQDWLKDIIRGTSILSDSYFSVGDVIKYKDIEGKVLVIGLKTTKIQDLKTGNIVSIANRNIEEVQNVSALNYINIPMPYELDIKSAEKIANEIVESIKKNSDVLDSRYLGVNNLDSSDIKYLIEVKCNPVNKLQVRRDSLRTVLLTLEKHKINVPYTQIDMHSK